MADPGVRFLFFVLLCFSPFLDEHRVEATPKNALSRGTDLRRVWLGPDAPGHLLENGERHSIRSGVEKSLLALADDQEGLAQSPIQRLADKKRTSAASPEPITDRAERQENPPSKPLAQSPWAAEMTTQANQTPVFPPGATRAADPPRLAVAQSSLSAAKADEEPDSQPKASSLIQLLEGREDELMVWLGIAITFFIFGWICGGSFYVRRDRNRRRKLRF